MAEPNAAYVAARPCWCGAEVLVQPDGYMSCTADVFHDPASSKRCDGCSEPVPDVREQVARAIAEAADDGVFDRDDPDSLGDEEDRDYWRRLADAALTAAVARPDPGASS